MKDFSWPIVTVLLICVCCGIFITSLINYNKLNDIILNSKEEIAKKDIIINTLKKDNRYMISEVEKSKQLKERLKESVYLLDASRMVFKDYVMRSKYLPQFISIGKLVNDIVIFKKDVEIAVNEKFYFSKKHEILINAIGGSQ